MIKKKNLLSYLLQKVKNHRGAALQNVHSSIWKVFGRERLPLLKSTISAAGIIRWKKSPQVDDCYRALFEKNSEGVFWVSIIARSAFSMVAVPTLTNHHCAFTLAVCDILLNPRSKTVLCKDKLMKRRMSQYINDFDNGGSNHNSAEEIMNSEIAGQELDELFGVNK
ncbi:4444_t:CDS:2 [Gigaspora rosea]|nr:4444_t:CDS:2 [Gigaspora rosea]